MLITIPLLAATLPLEALASAFDGGLMAAQETNFLSLVQISAIGFQIAAMTALVHTFGAQALTVYASFKVFMALRLVGSYHRSFLRRGSAYLRDLEGTTLTTLTTLATGHQGGNATGGAPGSGSATGDALDGKSLPVEPQGGGGQPRA